MAKVAEQAERYDGMSWTMATYDSKIKIGKMLSSFVRVSFV